MFVVVEVLWPNMQRGAGRHLLLIRLFVLNSCPSSFLSVLFVEEPQSEMLSVMALNHLLESQILLLIGCHLERVTVPEYLGPLLLFPWDSWLNLSAAGCFE